MRRALTSSSVTAAALLTTSTSIRHMNHPGWKTSLSTGDGRSKEQREIDRKARHLEKLPKALALHAPQYPYERSILADHTMQPLVFNDHLDTPTLFNHEGASDFFVYWNAGDFGRTQYPPVPEQDHRVLSADDTQYEELYSRHRNYLGKHHIIPNYFSGTPQSVNMSAVFSGTYDVRARTDEEGNLIPPPPPEKTLHARNFWFTAHYGNYIDLHEVQQAPSVFLNPPKEHVDAGAYYTFVMASPDYPYRTDPNATFMLNYVVANIPAAAVDASAPRAGTVVVPYAPPLPTEDAGCVRQLCFLYKQTEKIDESKIKEMSPSEEKTVFPFAARSAFRFHDVKSAEGAELRKRFASLAETERVLPSTPETVNFFHTKWDIQVQEYYEKIGEPEPAHILGERLEGSLKFLARSRESFRINSRYLADGTVNNGDNPLNYIRYAKTRMGENTSFEYRSRRHTLGANGKEKVMNLTTSKL